MDNDDPAAYLKQPPAPREHVLGQLVDLHDGAPVPFRMLAAVAVRLQDAAAWIGERAGLERKVKRHAWAALLALLGNVVLLGGVIAHSLRESGAAEERDAQRDRQFLEYRESVRRDMDRMEQDVRDLRRDLRRLSGADKLGPDSTDRRSSDDKYTELGRWNEALISTLPLIDSKLDPTSCFQTCNSNIECGGSTQFCKFCNFGECRSTRPETPTPPTDAGIDAAPGGTTP